MQRMGAQFRVQDGMCEAAAGTGGRRGWVMNSHPGRLLHISRTTSSQILKGVIARLTNESSLNFKIAPLVKLREISMATTAQREEMEKQGTSRKVEDKRFGCVNYCRFVGESCRDGV